MNYQNNTCNSKLVFTSPSAVVLCSHSGKSFPNFEIQLLILSLRRLSTSLWVTLLLSSLCIILTIILVFFNIFNIY